MCRGGGDLSMDRAARMSRWGIASERELKAAVATPGLTYLDVRTAAEVKATPLAVGGKRVPIVNCNVTMFSSAELEKRAPKLLPDKQASIVVFCEVGGRSDVAKKCLSWLGYTAVTNGGGMDDMYAVLTPEVLAAAPPAAGSGECRLL